MTAFTRIAVCDSVSATGKRISLTKPLAASAADATVYLSEALNIHSDEVAKCTHIAIVVPNAENSAHEVIACAIADYSAANATMSNCTRGVIAYGASISAVTALIAAHEAGATVSVPVLAQNMVQIQEVVEGERATGANAFRIGDEADSDIYLYFQNADGTKPGIRYNKTTNACEFSDNGSSWTALGASGNHGTTANLKDHTDVADAVSDSDARGDILFRNATEWTRLGAGTSGHVLKTAGAGADPAWTDPNTLVTTEVSDTAYDATSWNGVTTIAPSKNAVRDALELVRNQSVLQTTRTLDTASGSVNLAHGLGRTPKYIQVFAKCKPENVSNPEEYSNMSTSEGWSDGSSNLCIYAGTLSVGSNPYPSIMGAGNNATKCLYIENTSGSGSTESYQAATATFDATNVTLSFTKGAGGATETIYITIIVFG